MYSRDDETPMALQLRQSAEFKLQMGMAPGTKGWTIGIAALTLLHKLASNPNTAGDSLKLLHELQVHQVELDLQHEHLEENRRELEQRANHYAELYDFAPAALFTVDRGGHIVEGNLAAARLFAVAQEDLPGYGIDGMATPDGGPALRALLEQARSSGQRQCCRVQASTTPEWLEVVAVPAQREPYCLLMATPIAHAGVAAATP